MKDSTFNRWVMNLWFDHKDEYFTYNGSVCNEEVQQWFNRNKYWLKKVYREKANEQLRG